MAWKISKAAVCGVAPGSLALRKCVLTRGETVVRLGLLGILVLCLPTLAAAEMYKCVDAKGKTTYSGTPCETAQVQQKTFSSSGAGAAAPRQQAAARQGGQLEAPTAAECRQFGGYYVAGEGCLQEAPRNRSPGVAPERVAEECRKTGQRYVPALNACAQR